MDEDKDEDESVHPFPSVTTLMFLQVFDVS